MKKQPRTYLYLYGTVLYLPSHQLTRRVLYAGAARRSYNPVPRARNGNQGPSQLSPRHRRAPAGEATKRRGSGEAAKQVIVGWRQPCADLVGATARVIGCRVRVGLGLGVLLGLG